jgi:hypothetical protein
LRDQEPQRRDERRKQHRERRTDTVDGDATSPAISPATESMTMSSSSFGAIGSRSPRRPPTIDRSMSSSRRSWMLV